MDWKGFNDWRNSVHQSQGRIYLSFFHPNSHIQPDFYFNISFLNLLWKEEKKWRLNTSEVDFFLWGWLPQSCLCWAASNQCSDIIGPQSLNTPYVSGEINWRTDSETLSPPWWAHPARWSDRRAVSVLSTAASLFSLHVSDSLNSEVTHTHTHMRTLPKVQPQKSGFFHFLSLHFLSESVIHCAASASSPQRLKLVSQM